MAHHPEAAAVEELSDDKIAETIERLVAARDRGKTICPSEAARVVAQDWRPQMPAVRSMAFEMARNGRVSVFQRGVPVPLDRLEDTRGPIRIGHPQAIKE